MNTNLEFESQANNFELLLSTETLPLDASALFGASNVGSKMVGFVYAQNGCMAEWFGTFQTALLTSEMCPCLVESDYELGL